MLLIFCKKKNDTSYQHFCVGLHFFSFFVEEILSLLFIRLHCMQKFFHIDDFLLREAVCIIDFCCLRNAVPDFYFYACAK